jgi:hypothetical protein
MKTSQPANAYDKYEGIWIALADDCEMPIGKGDTREAALAEARANGFADATLTFVPQKSIAFIRTSL